MSQSVCGNFPRIFWIFWVFFVTLNIFWVFPQFVLHWKIISKKIKPYPSHPGRARRPDPHPTDPRTHPQLLSPQPSFTSWPSSWKSSEAPQTPPPQILSSAKFQPSSARFASIHPQSLTSGPHLSSLTLRRAWAGLQPESRPQLCSPPRRASLGLHAKIAATSALFKMPPLYPACPSQPPPLLA
jgi:hypothetical protein